MYHEVPYIFEQGTSVTIPIWVSSYLDKTMNIQLSHSILAPEEQNYQVATVIPTDLEFPTNATQNPNIIAIYWNQTEVFRYEFAVSNITLQPRKGIQTNVTIFVMNNIPIRIYKLWLYGKAKSGYWESLGETTMYGPPKIGNIGWMHFIRVVYPIEYEYP